MRVLLLNFEYPPIGGGAGYAAQNLLREWAKAGLAVDVVTSSRQRADSVERIGRSVVIHRLDVGKADIHYWRAGEIARYALRGTLLARRLLRARRYAVVHAFFSYPCGVMARLSGRPYLVSVRGFDVPGFNARLGWLDLLNTPLLRKVWRDARVVVANSAGLRDLARRTAPQQPFEVIYNGVNTQEFYPAGWTARPAEPQAFAPPPGFGPGAPLKLLCVSRLIPRKGVDRLIAAMRLLKNKPVHLTLVGEGDAAAALKAAARGLSIAFLDYVRHEELLPVYQSHHIFVLPSHNEGMSNTVLEAMACGLPIIATDTGGTAELVNLNGLILKDNSPKAIAAAVGQFLDNPGLIASMGRLSRRRAEDLGWDRIAAQYLALYARVAGKPEAR